MPRSCLTDFFEKDGISYPLFLRVNDDIMEIFTIHDCSCEEKLFRHATINQKIIITRIYLVNCNLTISNNQIMNWRLLSLSELTPMTYNMGLTHLGSEISNYISNYNKTSALKLGRI